MGGQRSWTEDGKGADYSVNLINQAEVEESLYQQRLQQRNSLATIYISGVCPNWLTIDEMKKTLTDVIYLIAYQQQHWKLSHHTVIGMLLA